MQAHYIFMATVYRILAFKMYLMHLLRYRPAIDGHPMSFTYLAEDEYTQCSKACLYLFVPVVMFVECLLECTNFTH